MGECFLYKRGGGSGGAPAQKETEKTVFGKSLVLTDSTSKPLKSLRIFGRTTQAGTPSPDNPVRLVSPGDGGSITVEVGASNGGQNIQRLVCNTPNGLPGLKVSSGGNYADENGQQWICDEIDFARGKYVQRVKLGGMYDFYRKDSIILPSDPQWYNAETSNSYEMNWSFVEVSTGKVLGLCNVLPSYFFASFYGKGIVDGVMNSNRNMVINLDKARGIDTIEKFIAWCNEVDIKFLKHLIEPIETDLTAEELAQYAALHTNSLYTTISNTAAADMELTYIAIGG